LAALHGVVITQAMERKASDYHQKIGGNRATLVRKESFPDVGVSPPSGYGAKFIAKPSGSVSTAVTTNENLEKGGDKGNNSGRRYRFNNKAFNSLVTWLLLGYKWTECRHIVFTIPDFEYWNYPCYGDLNETEEKQKEREHYWQDKFKKLLERCRYYNYLGEYAWFKELTTKKQTGQYDKGVMHWHFLNHGYLPFKKINALWSDVVRPNGDVPYYKGIVKHKPNAAKLYSENIARYFGSYFHKNDKFYTKAYRLPQLPKSLEGGSIEVDQEKFNEIASKALYRNEYATVWETKMEAYKNLVNGVFS
jgi:hypothetical protein